jgi:hypothetical protein
VLFVFVDVNSRVFAFVEGDESPFFFFGVGLSFFALRFGFAQSVSVRYLFLMFFSQVFTAEFTYGYTIRQSLMGFGNCIGGRTFEQHTCDIDIDVFEPRVSVCTTSCKSIRLALPFRALACSPQHQHQ